MGSALLIVFQASLALAVSPVGKGIYTAPGIEKCERILTLKKGEEPSLPQNANGVAPVQSHPTQAPPRTPPGQQDFTPVFTQMSLYLDSAMQLMSQNSPPTAISDFISGVQQDLQEALELPRKDQYDALLEVIFPFVRAADLINGYYQSQSSAQTTQPTQSTSSSQTTYSIVINSIQQTGTSSWLSRQTNDRYYSYFPRNFSQERNLVNFFRAISSMMQLDLFFNLSGESSWSFQLWHHRPFTFSINFSQAFAYDSFTSSLSRAHLYLNSRFQFSSGLLTDGYY